MLWVNPQALSLVSQSLSSSLSWPTEIPNCPCSARPFYSLACTFCWLTLAVLNFSCLPETFWPVAPSYVPDCALSQGHRCCLSYSLTLLDYHSAQCMGSKNISECGLGRGHLGLCLVTLVALLSLSQRWSDSPQESTQYHSNSVKISKASPSHGAHSHM